MSNRLGHAVFMKMKISTKRLGQSRLHAFLFRPTTIARFGRASLVKHFDGPYELLGGTAEERAAAREWCSLFAPQVVFAAPLRPDAALAITA
jgi:hypothetical protein